MNDALLEHYGFDPASEDADESSALLAFALESGASEQEIRHAIAGGFLHAVPVRRGLVGGNERWTFAEIAERAGLEADFARRLWTEVGLPEDEATSFSERDVPLFEYFVWSLERFGRDETLYSARVLGASIAQLADSEIAQIRTALEAPLRRSGGTRLDTGRLLLGLLDIVPRLHEAILVMHRRQLVSAGQRYALWGVRASAAGTTDCVVGFADMVGFTTLCEHLAVAELDTLLRTFEHRVLEAATSTSSRLVKLIGDEALFVAGSVEDALAIASVLLHDPDIPDLRIGLAAGEVVTRGGDVYGSVVNLASRLVAIADPGQILADARTVGQLHPRTGAGVEALGSRPIAGFEDPVEVSAISLRPATS
jgi:adenylate cyclase